jgi:hypothetical protein
LSAVKRCLLPHVDLAHRGGDESGAEFFQAFDGLADPWRRGRRYERSRGRGKRLLYEIHCIDRFERVQDFCSYSRLVKRLERQQGKAKALAILSHRIERAVYFMLKRNQVFEMATFLAT